MSVCRVSVGYAGKIRDELFLHDGPNPAQFVGDLGKTEREIELVQ